MRTALVLAAAMAMAGGFVSPASATLQPDMYCWVSDVEIPVDCGDEEGDDDDGAHRVARVTGNVLLRSGHSRAN
jgi:hypothetical protein